MNEPSQQNIRETDGKDVAMDTQSRQQSLPRTGKLLGMGTLTSRAGGE